MGIADRDYYRRDPPTPGAYGGVSMRSMRMWSANTWLIVICVAIFAIDHFLPPIPVHMGDSIRADIAHQIDTDALQEGVFRQVSPFEYEAPLIATDQNGEPVVVGLRRWMEMPLLRGLLHFSTAKGFLSLEFWRLVGFQFLHGSLPHLLFNMLGLYFFGPMVERYLGAKRYLAFYLLCGICGALMFSLLNLSGIVVRDVFNVQTSIPFLLFHDPFMPLVGASAGVYGVLMAGAYLAPNAVALLFFIIPLKLKWLAYGLVAVSLYTIWVAGTNAGGEAGHLGGAIAGIYFIRHPHHLHGFFDILGRIDPTSHHYRGKTAGARAVGKMRAPGKGGAPPRNLEVDRILDKVQAEGLQSLTPKERRILREASDKGR